MSNKMTTDDLPPMDEHLATLDRVAADLRREQEGKSALYAQHIVPLMDQVHALAVQHNIPFLAQFGLESTRSARYLFSSPETDTHPALYLAIMDCRHGWKGLRFYHDLASKIVPLEGLDSPTEVAHSGGG